MASSTIWLEVLSLVKAVFDASTLGADVVKAYERHKGEPDTRRAAEIASIRYSTYSEKEIDSIVARLQECRDRFILEGSGAQRHKCICSVFRDLIEGNGGVLPRIDDWQRICEQLCPDLLNRRR